jgi:hypothetical protein
MLRIPTRRLLWHKFITTTEQHLGVIFGETHAPITVLCSAALTGPAALAVS